MKKLLFSLMFFLSAFAVMAQEQYTVAEGTDESDTLNKAAHYLVFDIGGGLHFHTYGIDKYGSKTPGAGFMARAGYRFFFNEHWGVGTELNMKTYKTTATLDFVQEIEGATDEQGERYLHRTYFHDLKEQQKQFALNIPLGVYYQTKLSEKWKAVAGLGFFYQIAEFSNKYKTTGGSLETRGYYQKYNVELFGMEQHNFYEADNFKGNNTKLSCMGLYTEGDLLYQINPKWEINLGLYFSYGLDYQSESKGNILYNPDCLEANAYQNPVYHGVTESSLVDKQHPLAVGLMAGVRYRLGKSGNNKILGDDDLNKNKPTPDDNDNNTDTTGIDNNNDPNMGNGGDGNGDNVDNGNGDNGDNNVDNGNDGNGDNNNNGDDGRVDRDKYQNIGDVIVAELKKFNKVSVNFAFNDAQIKATPAQKEMFDAVAKFMKEYPSLTLHIVGHTCNIGTLQQNKIVGQRRADATKKEMTDRGVPADRITTESKAYLEPLVPNTNEENRKKNRRIEFSVTEK